MSLIVTLDHLAGVPGYSTSPGFCRPRAREWFRANGLDWNEFRHHGIDAELLLATGNPMARSLVEHARAVEAAKEAARGEQ